LTAKALVIPGEDPEKAALLAQSIFDEVQPIGALENELCEAIVSACNLRRHCDRALTGTLTEQLQNALDDIDRLIEEDVARCRALYRERKFIEAVEGLRQTSLGCAYLIERWEYFRDVLNRYGFLSQHVLREMGNPLGEYLAQDTYTTPAGFWLSFHALYCRSQPTQREVNSIFGLTPDDILAAYRSQWPDPQANRAELLRRIEEALTELREREEYLRRGPEAVQKAQAQAQAAMIQEPQAAGSWLRYYKESHTELFRSLQQLRIAQAERRAAEEAADEEKSASMEVAEEPKEPAEAAAEASSEGAFPNDPKVPDLESQEASESGTCDTNSGINSETRYRAMLHAMAILDAAGFAKPPLRGAVGGVSG
jgi:hypothetical protein